MENVALALMEFGGEDIKSNHLKINMEFQCNTCCRQEVRDAEN